MNNKEKETIEELERPHPILEFFITKFKATSLFIVFLVVAGLYSYIVLPRESAPEIVVPIGLVATVFPGAPPVDVEELITQKIEEELDGLDDVKDISSTSALGISTIVVEFDAKSDIDKSLQALKDAVDLAKPKLPKEAEDPFVTDIDFNNQPVMRITLSSDLPDMELQRHAQDLALDIQSMQDVRDVTISGKRDIEWQINLDPQKLIFYNVPYNQLAGAVDRNNVNFPAGSLDIDNRLYTVRVDQKYNTVADLKTLPIAAKGDSFLYLEDVADVLEGFSDLSSKARFFSAKTHSVNPSLTLNVIKVPRTNIIKVVSAVKERVEKLKEAGSIPENVSAEVVYDEAFHIRDSLKNLQTSALQAVLIILVVLFIALSFRAAFIASLIIPLSFLSTFILLNRFGITLNGMTMFSLILALGLLVDTSIVITEGMYEYLKKGLTPVQASIASVKEFQLPVISGVATTIATFVPMLLVSGVVGQYLRTIPMTASIVLISSLFLSLTILPALGAKYFKADVKDGWFSKIRQKKDTWLINLQNKYKEVMKPVLESRKKCWIAIIAVVLALAGTSLFPIFGLLDVGFFPRIDFPNIYINVKAPYGSSLEETERLLKQAEEKLVDIPEAENFVTTIGSNFSLSGSGSSAQHLAFIVLTLKDEDERERKSYEIIDEDIRPTLSEITGLDITVEDVTGGPPSGAPVEVRIMGSDLKQLELIADRVKGFLEEIEGAVDISDDMEPGLPEFVFKLKREELAYYNLSAAEVAGFLRTLVYGNTISSVVIAGQDIDIVIKTNEVTAKNIEELKGVDILTAKGPVALGSLAEISFAPSLDVINHKDLNRILHVRSFVSGVTPADVTKALKEKLKDYKLEQGYSILYGGEMEDIDQSFKELWNAMLVAVFLIFLILVLQFNSFKQTLLILTSIPFAMIGVILGLTIMRLQLNFPAFIGIISLAGIAVNDAIILMSQINNNLHEKGNPENPIKVDNPIKGIVSAGALRIQPILVTTLTTVLSLIPITFADPSWKALGYAIIWGLSFATVLTLVIIPIQYVLWQRKKLGV